MKIYLSRTHSDEDGEFAEEGKMGKIYGNKEDILNLCSFFRKVEKHLRANESCHMHFRDSFVIWNKMNHIDLEINLVEEEPEIIK